MGKIENIGEIIDDELPEGNPGRAKVILAEIVVVVSIDVYKSCRNCSTKIIDSGTLFVVCSKCGSKMKLNKCVNCSVANIILEDEDKKEHKVTIFNKVLSIVSRYGKDAIRDQQGECDIEHQLLSAPPSSYTLNQKDIILNFALFHRSVRS